MPRFTVAKSPTQITPVPLQTPFLDKTSPSGVAPTWIRHLQAVQAQQPMNPTFVAQALSPLTVDAIHNVLFISPAGAFTVQLGPSKSSPFSFYVIINATGGGAITILPDTMAPIADTINGLASLMQVNAQWRVTILIPDGKSNWEAFSVAGGG
jgi:hypothetical protein